MTDLLRELNLELQPTDFHFDIETLRRLDLVELLKKISRLESERDDYRAALISMRDGIARPDGKWGYQCHDIANRALAKYSGQREGG